MNNEDFYSADFTNSLPPALKNDPDMMALSQTISAQLQTTAAEIRKNIIYARIDELDEATLDVLAYDLHVDWYDYSYPIEVKRRTIRDSIQVHRRLGTKYAVEKALGAVYPGTKVEEWFEYGGDPYKFRVVIGATEAGITADRQAAVLDRVRFIKTCGHTLKQSVTKSKSEQRSRLPPSTLSGNASKSTHTWREIWNRAAGSTAADIRSTGGNLQYSRINNERRVKKWKIKRMEPL